MTPRPKRAAPRRGTARDLLAYFQQHPGVALVNTQIAADTGLDVGQISSGVLTIRKNYGDGCVTNPSMGTYVFHGTDRRGGPRLFEEIAVTKSGTILVQEAETGTIYRLTEIE